MSKIFKKLVLVLAIFLLIAQISMKNTLRWLYKVLYIYYWLYFWKNTANVRALINSGNKINTMTLVYINKLDLKGCYIYVKIQKIDSSIFQIFEIILANFQIKNKLKKAWFFWKTFLLANISVKMVLVMLFWFWIVKKCYLQKNSLLEGLILQPKLGLLLNK